MSTTIHFGKDSRHKIISDGQRIAFLFYLSDIDLCYAIMSHTFDFGYIKMVIDNDSKFPITEENSIEMSVALNKYDSLMTTLSSKEIGNMSVNQIFNLIEEKAETVHKEKNHGN